ncbi:hypothetical protein [Streptomyces pristinaespiralis]|uniref:hypothetical protein n=1 Tax=Streptomyces pristinaespiralis TaxID=38300 RepID=UPI0033E5FC5C
MGHSDQQAQAANGVVDGVDVLPGEVGDDVPLVEGDPDRVDKNRVVRVGGDELGPWGAGGLMGYAAGAAGFIAWAGGTGAFIGQAGGADGFTGYAGGLAGCAGYGG